MVLFWTATLLFKYPSVEFMYPSGTHQLKESLKNKKTNVR